MQELKDTQSEADTRNISIDRVGVQGLRFPLQIQDKLNRIQSTVATVSLAAVSYTHLDVYKRQG